MLKHPKYYVGLGIVLAILVVAAVSVSPVQAQSVVESGTSALPCTPPTAPSGFGYYVVQKGETPQSIANKFGVPLSTVLSLNTGASFNRNTIILLPSVEGPWNNALLCSTTAAYPSISKANLTPVSAAIPVTGSSGTSSATTSLPMTVTTSTTSCTPPSAPTGYGFYVIQKGDTPQSIANKFGVPLSTVLSLNTSATYNRGSIILMPSVEKAGLWNNAQLCNTKAAFPSFSQANLSAISGGIPVTGSSTTTSTGTTAAGTVNQSCTPPTAPKGFGYYVVQKGETAQSIANKFGVPLATVQSLNPSASFNRNTTILLPNVEIEGVWNNAQLCRVNVTPSR